MPAAPFRTAFGSRCAKSPVACNRIDYFTASFHLADIVLLPSTDTRGFGATIGYGMSMSLFHRLEVGIGGTASIWNQPTQGLLFQNGPALLNIKGVLFPLLRNPLPDTEFTFALHLQQQLRIPKFDGPNDLGTLTPLTALRAVADQPFWRMGITGSLGFLLTPGRTDTELAASVRLHIPGMSRATVQGFGVLQGLFGSSRTAPLRGGFGLSVPLRLGQRHVYQRRLHARQRRRRCAERDLHRRPRLSHRSRNIRAVLLSPADSQSRVCSVSLAVAHGTSCDRSGTKQNSRMKLIAEARTG
jgi:hypothetical protein